MTLFKREKKIDEIHENIIKINLYSRTPIGFTIQFQTLIFVNRANVCVVRKILEIWCTCNILVKPCIISGFFTLFMLLSLPVSEHSIYLCSNSFELPMYSLRLCVYTGSFSFLLLLDRPNFVLRVICFCTCFVLLFVLVSIFTFTR